MVQKQKAADLKSHLVRIEMARQLLEEAALAKRMGICLTALRRYIARGFPSAFLRARCEAALSYAPIWSTASVLEVRRRCLEVYGYDPALLVIGELRRRAVERGVPGPITKMLQPDLLSAFLAHLAVNPTHTP